jgi:predicted XRE-type DNA-binding protein
MQGCAKTSLSRTHRLRARGPCDLDQAHVKAVLARRIIEALRTTDMTQIAAAGLLGIDQPKVSRLMRGQLAEFSTPRLLRFLALLGQDIQITVHSPNPQEPQHVGKVSVVADGGSQP